MKKGKYTPHDGLVKKLMENPLTAREFLEEYLPVEFKSMVDLSTICVEKESFVEKSLLKQLSDVVLSVRTKNNDKAFIYTLIEAQVNPDYWLSFRLWKYMLLLSERHATKKDKLPLIFPLVFYHGTKKYDAPRNLWQLFADPLMAKELMTNDYTLVDLEAMSDDEINYNKHLSIMIYMMKHINQRNKLKLIENIFKNCSKAVLIDSKVGYIYIKLMIWYTKSKIMDDQQGELERLIIDNLPKNDSEVIMRTIAQAYIEEGEARGEARGKAIGEAIGEVRGEARGEAKGEAKRSSQIAIKMLQQKLDLRLISSITGIKRIELLKLKSKI